MMINYGKTPVQDFCIQHRSPTRLTYNMTQALTKPQDRQHKRRDKVKKRYTTLRHHKKGNDTKQTYDVIAPSKTCSITKSKAGRKSNVEAPKKMDEEEENKKNPNVWTLDFVCLQRSKNAIFVCFLLSTYANNIVGIHIVLGIYHIVQVCVSSSQVLKWL